MSNLCVSHQAVLRVCDGQYLKSHIAAMSRTRSFSVALFCLALFCIAPSASAEAVLPPDVAKYIERRDTCDHWRGEEGDDKERQADIKRGQCQSCPGSDSGLAKLTKKYETNKAVRARLAQYEGRIEPLTAKERRTVCKDVPVVSTAPKK